MIQNIRFGKFPLDHDLVAENVMKDFDKDGDQMISEQEFISGFTKWIHKATHIANSKDTKNFIDEFDKVNSILLHDDLLKERQMHIYSQNLVMIMS